MAIYFTNPTQVMFYDSSNEKFIAGIGYNDEIICGCCGAIFEISDVLEDAQEMNISNPIRVFDTWVDLEDAIVGDVDIEDPNLFRFH